MKQNTINSVYHQSILQVNDVCYFDDFLSWRLSNVSDTAIAILQRYISDYYEYQ